MAFRKRFLAALLASIAIAVLVACDLGGGPDPGQDTRSPEPAPAIDQPEFQIGEIAHRNLAGEGGLIEVEFEIQVANSGGAGSGEVSVGIDGQDPEAVSGLGELAAGSSTVVAFTRQLAPGPHRMTVTAGAARTTHAFAVRASDLQLTSAAQPEIGADRVGFRLLLENVGDDPVDGITLTATWSSSGDAGERGEFEVPLDFASLAAGDDSQISFEVQIPAGQYQLAMSADSAGIDADLSNNRIEFEFGFDYVGIQTTAESSEVRDWTRDGEAVVAIGVSFANVGLVASKPTFFGVQCPADAGPDCGQRLELSEIAVGATVFGDLSLNLPPGTHKLRVFAGAAEDSFQLGPDNVVDLEVTVPPQPARRLIAHSNWEIDGYRSSGHAAIKVNYSLRNAGSEPVRDPVTVSFVCWLDGQVVPDCGSEFAIELQEGFGPTESTWELFVPTGVELRSEPGGGSPDETGFQVPSPILGLEHYVWDCYRDRPESGLIGCAGWSTPTVRKWPPGQPISYWAGGDPDYIGLFEEQIARFSEPLHLQFVPAQSRESAQFLAFVGVPEADPDLNPGACPSGSYCGGPYFDGGVITRAEITVPHFGDLADSNNREFVERYLLAGFLSATTGIERRPTLDSTLDEKPGISPLEFELLRLNSHPLVEPDMEMSQVLDLIVFGDQLLDPTPPSEFGIAFDAVRAAIAELTRAGSARYWLTNRVSGLCFTGNFGPAVYEIGGLDDEPVAIGQFRKPDFVRFIWGNHDYVIDGGRDHYQRDGDQWRLADEIDILHAAGWYEEHSGLFDVLERTLKITDPEALTASFGPGGQLTIRTVEEHEIATRQMTVVIDTESNRFLRFSDHVNIYDTCQATSNAELADYGVELIDFTPFG